MRQRGAPRRAGIAPGILWVAGWAALVVAGIGTLLLAVRGATTAALRTAAKGIIVWALAVTVVEIHSMLRDGGGGTGRSDRDVRP